MDKPTTIGAWLDWAKNYVSPTDAETIAVVNYAPEGSDRSWIITHPDHPLPDDFDDPFSPANTMIDERHKGVPLQYLLGYQDFYGRKFCLTNDVLIPRPESEAIIDLAKKLDLPAAPRIVDIGTGSGCLAVTLALEFPQAEVVGVDTSELALSIAELNDHRFEGRAVFAYSDLLSEFNPEKQGSFDLMVANLPYVNPEWDWIDHKALSFEPAAALFPEQGKSENGLSAYHRLFDELATYTATAPVANLILEADPCQHEELIALAASSGWKHHATLGYALAFRPASDS